jgi:hypothetical protein
MVKKKMRTGKTAAAASILDKYEGLKRVLGQADGTARIAEIVSESAAFLARETRVLPLQSLVGESATSPSGTATPRLEHRVRSMKISISPIRRTCLGNWRSSK